MHLYHGSKNLFKRFDLSRIREYATSEGVGFYLTDNWDVADRYAGLDGFVHTFKFRGTKNVGYNEKIVTNNEWEKLIVSIHEEEDILSNFGDINYDGYNKVLSEAIRMLTKYNESDIDILSELCNICGDIGRPLRHIYETLGYDHCIAHPDWGKQKIYLIFSNEAIEYVSSQKRT